MMNQKQGFAGKRERPWMLLSGKIKEGFANKTAGNRFIQALEVNKWSLLLILMALLLGKAAILDELSPFAIAFFAAMYCLRRDLLFWTGAALLAGSLLSSPKGVGYLFTEIVVFLLIQKGLDKFERADMSYVPLIVFFSTFPVKLFSGLVSSDMTWYQLLMLSVDSVLSFVLTLIFLQAIPVFTPARKKYNLKNEEVICLIILLASVMTGTLGWSAGPLSVEHVLSRYLILLFALVGGAPLGASVGVITGMILSLADANAVYQMSLLAFAGMLGGLMKEGGRPAVALGMLLGSSILSIYIGDQTTILGSLQESVAAAFLFFCTTKEAVRGLAKYVPGTQENLNTHYEYAKRVRDITAGRVEQFSEVFRQLSRSFKQLTAEGQTAKREREMEHFMETVAQKSCATCWKRKTCWDEQFYATYKVMTEMMTAIEADERLAKRDIPAAWRKVCVKSDLVLPILKKEYQAHKHDLHWRRQIIESRQLVADQLIGVSQVMEDLAKEIKREGQELYIQEEQIRKALEDLGLSIQGVEIISLEEGNVEIEVVHPYTKGFDECRKIIAPLLSDILGETIAVGKEEDAGGGMALVTFESAKAFLVETGVAGAAKDGGLLSGDSFSTVELGNGKFAVALSDGMGNGERAREESSTALTVLQQLLKSGMDERLAIKSVNSVLMLRSPEEIFATVDMALIDLYSGHTTFMKIGSTPSFIKRGDEVIPVSANNLPVGILQEIDVDLVGIQLQDDDLLILMSDGIYDAPGCAINKELWMKRVIQEIDSPQPQDFADCLLERIVRHLHGEITDDMTVVAARISRRQPEWATFRWPGVSRIERPKVVS